MVLDGIGSGLSKTYGRPFQKPGSAFPKALPCLLFSVEKQAVALSMP